jgi:nucleotide-binding universal stress UspA family protein
MYENILVPVDGSDASLDALDEAVALAAEQDARLNLLYVVETAAASGVSGMDVLGAMEEAGERAVSQASDRVREAGLDVDERNVVHGVPHQSILDAVEEWEADLVVMGTHGRTGLGRFLLGSVTEKVVRLSPVPVLTIRPEREHEEE